MSTPVAQFEAGVLNGLAAYLTANQPAIVAAVAAGDIDIEGAVKNLLSNIPKVTGVAGVLVDPLEASLFAAAEAALPTLLAKYGGQYLVSAIVNFLQAEATKLVA